MTNNLKDIMFHGHNLIDFSIILGLSKAFPKFITLKELSGPADGYEKILVKTYVDRLIKEGVIERKGRKYRVALKELNHQQIGS